MLLGLHAARDKACSAARELFSCTAAPPGAGVSSGADSAALVRLRAAWREVDRNGERESDRSLAGALLGTAEPTGVTADPQTSNQDLINSNQEDWSSAATPLLEFRVEL